LTPKTDISYSSLTSTDWTTFFTSAVGFEPMRAQPTKAPLATGEVLAALFPPG